MGVDCNILSSSAFEDLVAAVGEEFVPTLMAVFFSDLSDVVTKASTAAASGDPLAFATQMHALRGTSASIGAMMLSEISSRYDRLSATDPAPTSPGQDHPDGRRRTAPQGLSPWSLTRGS